MKPTEKDYELLENLGAKLHIATPTAKWGFKVEKDGVVLLDTIERAHSWTRNAYNLLVCQMCAVSGPDSTFGDGYISIKTTTGGSNASNYPISQELAPNIETSSGYIGAAGDSIRGIVIGLDDVAYSFDDYKLNTKITNGTGVNQMAYAKGTLTKTFDSVTKKYNVTHARNFNNNSAADIIVKEVGVVGYIGSGNCLVCRDVLGTPVTVPAASKLTVSYTMSVQFPG